MFLLHSRRNAMCWPMCIRLLLCIYFPYLMPMSNVPILLGLYHWPGYHYERISYRGFCTRLRRFDRYDIASVEMLYAIRKCWLHCRPAKSTSTFDSSLISFHIRKHTQTVRRVPSNLMCELSSVTPLWLFGISRAI